MKSTIRWHLLSSLAALTCATLPVHAADYHVPDRRPDALAGAIRHANLTPQSDTLHLAAGGLYTFSSASEDDLALPRVSGSLRILGNGAELRRNTDSSLSLIEVTPGARLQIERLTLAEGSRGSIRNFGSLDLLHCAVVDSTTTAESAIVMNHGQMTLQNSVVGFNQVSGAARDAAIILNFGKLRLLHSSLEENSLSRRYASLHAAAVLNYGEIQIDQVTFVQNSITDGLDGIVSGNILNLGIGRVSGPDSALLSTRVRWP